MIKHYVLDSSTLLYDPESLLAFEDNNVHIPIIVLEELDGFKKEMSELGVNARKVINYLDSLRSKGKLNLGVKLESGGTVFVSSSDQKIDSSLLSECADNKLLQLSAYLKTLNHGTKVILVTKDINLRVKADAIGIDAEDYKRPSEGDGTDYTGITEVIVEDGLINKMYADEFVECPQEITNIYENQYVVLTSSSNDQHKGMGVYRKGRIYSVKKKIKAIGISPKNMKQFFALEALLNSDIQVVTIAGISGCGKTLLAVAAALQQTMFEDLYNKITITRPVVSVGKELGFTPGSIEEKYAPWTRPIYDALDFIVDTDAKNGKTKIPATFNSEDYIDIAPLTYIRGRSFMNSFMIVDESQNLSPLEIKTIATRVGQGTKIVFTGDIYQIDSPYLNKHSNGLSQLIKRFKGQDFYAHITLTDGERSVVAEAAANLL